MLPKVKTHRQQRLEGKGIHADRKRKSRKKVIEKDRVLGHVVLFKSKIPVSNESDSFPSGANRFLLVTYINAI